MVAISFTAAFYTGSSSSASLAAEQAAHAADAAAVVAAAAVTAMSTAVDYRATVLYRTRYRKWFK